MYIDRKGVLHHIMVNRTRSTSREELIEYRTLGIADYIMLHHATIRMAALAYCVPKSTAHGYIHRHLSKLDPIMYEEVCTILHENWTDRQRRAGYATAAARKERMKNGSD